MAGDQSRTGVRVALSGSGALRGQGPNDDRRHTLEVERLDEVVEGPGPHGPHGRLEVAERGHDDDRRGGHHAP